VRWPVRRQQVFFPFGYGTPSSLLQPHGLPRLHAMHQISSGHPLLARTGRNLRILSSCYRTPFQYQPSAARSMLSIGIARGHQASILTLANILCRNIVASFLRNSVRHLFG
jgi:hypothetical protein